jgi:hypothetical protein
METCTWKTKEEMNRRETVWIRDGWEWLGFVPVVDVDICGVEPSRFPGRDWISSICACRRLELPIDLSRLQLTNYLAV